MVVSKIKTRVASSKLLFQKNFDKASNQSPLAAHYKAVVAALFVLLLSTLLLVGPPADYWAARSLLSHGLSSKGVVENVSVKTQPRGRGGKEYITTIDYRFVGDDGQIYHGNSSIKADRPQPVVTGDSIEVVHDGYRPSNSAWRTALHGTEAEVYGVMFASFLVLSWCMLSLYRYARWTQRRRSSRANSSV
jgi:hypothetical protein